MPESLSPSDSWRLPRRRDALSYWLRTRLLSLWALARQAFTTRRWSAAEALAEAPVVAQSRSPLWTEGDDGEFALTAGKVENLRVAIRAFHGVEVPAGGVLSFWAQLGRPSASRGFVVGREVREGCVVPTVAGGICQLSNALADLAAQAGLEFVERHGHTARIGEVASPADATVFWRHVDLKLRAAHAWRLDVTMDERELVVSLRSHARSLPRSIPVAPHRDAPALVRGCLTCDERDCFRHATHRALHGRKARTAALLDGWSPEFAARLASQPLERFAPMPMRLAFWRPVAKSWGDVASRARWASLRGALWRRLWARREGGRRQAAILDAQRWLAQAHAAALTPLHTRLVVDQALLPHLELCGALAGREVEVLAHSLPMADIQVRLDAAAQRWPQDESLRDYRAPPSLVTAEARALARARSIVTPHAEVAAVLGLSHGARVTRLAWAAATVWAPAAAEASLAPLLLFAAPPRARKGWLELTAALQGLSHRLRTLGTPHAGDPLDGVSAVVLPAHVEHAPRLLLRALACGLPVIATPACGLDAGPGLVIVQAGDVAALHAALAQVLMKPHHE